MWRAGHRQSAPPWCLPGEGGETDRSKATFPPPTPRGPPAELPRMGGAPTTPPPPPPARLTHRRPARPRPAARAAKRPRLSMYAWKGCAGNKGGPEPGATGKAPGGGRSGTTARPPLPSPPTPPFSSRDAGDGPRGRRPSTPPRGRGEVPPPPKRAAAPGGGEAAELVRHAPPRPHQAAPTGVATGKLTRASAQGRHTDHARGQRAYTNRSSMEATPSMT